MDELKTELRRMATAAGAQRLGFARLAPVDDNTVRHYEHFLRDGRNGTMAYLANYPQIRRDPRRLLVDDGENADTFPSDGTIIVAAFSYYTQESPQHNPKDDTHAIFARYSRGSDYHDILRQRMRPLTELITAKTGASCRICVDSAPINERYWAKRAGIGITGLNRQLIIPGMGSYFFLAEIITSAVIPPDTPCEGDCGKCGRCISACPGSAIGPDGTFNANRCLSYLTIEYRGELPETIHITGEQNINLREAMGNRVYGCDACQECCPHNRKMPETTVDEFLPRPEIQKLTLGDIQNMTQDNFSRIFSKSAIKRCKLSGLQRNARFIRKMRSDNTGFCRPDNLG